MSEKDANEDAHTLENGSNSEAAQALPEEESEFEPLDAVFDGKIKKKENESIDLDSYLSPYESHLKKEENPFSFKKFLNQDFTAQQNKGARKKIFTPSANSSSSDKSDFLNHRTNRVSGDLNSRISTNDMSSVLPDFVQDHLVIEQCYLSSSPPDINTKNLNPQNLPDLNSRHKNVHFMVTEDRNTTQPNNSSNNLSPNLPDFTFSASNFLPGAQNKCNNKRLPDFALHDRADFNNGIDLGFSGTDISNANDTSQSFKQRTQISSSPSVPSDLPSYEESNLNLTIPFDLTAPTEESSGTTRGRPNETVSKSLPDFLSDGPIKKEMDDNFQNVRGIAMQNGLLADIPLTRTEDRLLREIDLLRCQLVEKNRRLDRLEKEVEHLHSTDQRETASLEYALQEVENNLKQTAKRALNAENVVLKLKQENKTLKSEISLLRSENVSLRLGGYESHMSPSQEIKNHKIARELKAAANQAENSLKSLLIGVGNLRALADTIANSHKFQDANKDFKDFYNEDSASGPAL